MSGFLRKSFAVMSLFFLLCGIFPLYSCTNAPSETEVLLSGFENYEEMTKMTYGGFFGRVSLNRDPAYVSEGEASAKLNPIGDTFQTTAKPTLSVPLDGGNGNYSDLSSLKKVKIDFYNCSQREISVNYYFVFGKDGAASQKNALVLEGNGWSRISVGFDSRISSLNFNLNEASALCFEFFPEGSSVSDLYLDNLRLVFGEQSEDVSSVMELDENEICSFDRLYQEFCVSISGYDDISGIEPVLSINSDPAYSKTGRSLCMLAPEGHSEMASWPYFEFSRKLIEKVGFSDYGDDSCFALDVYNANDKEMWFYVDFWRKAPAEKRTFSFCAVANTWTSFILPFGEINAGDTSLNRLTDGLDIIRVCYYEFVGKGEQTFYFDSFRIIPGNDQGDGK